MLAQLTTAPSLLAGFRVSQVTTECIANLVTKCTRLQKLRLDGLSKLDDAAIVVRAAPCI